MGHAQTVYNFPTLDASMKLEVDEIEHYDGELEADTTNLKWDFYNSELVIGILIFLLLNSYQLTNG